MSAYRSTVKGSIAFDGDVVPYELKRISYADALDLVGKSGVEATAVLRPHVVALEVKDAAGEAIPLDVVFRDFYFASLLGKLLVALMATGKVPKDKADPSVGNSPASLPGDNSPEE